MRRFTAHHLLPGEGADIDFCPINVLCKDRRGRIDKSQPLAAGRDPVCVRHAHARSCTIPGKDNIAVKIHMREVRQLAIICY